MKKLLNFLGVSMLFALPVAFFSQWFDFDKVSALFFAITVAILLYIYRDRVAIQKIIFPFLYLILIRTKVGLKLMDKLADKFREFIKLLGLSFIGLGFLGMIYISIMFFRMMLMLVKAPLETSKGVALILPFTEVPGVGYLSFWYFIIGIFFIAVIHEFAHGVMARAHKLNVQSSGVGFFAAILPIIPIAFVEPNEKKLVKEKDHIQYSIFAAGPAINIIVAIIIAIILPYTAYGMLSLQEYAPFEEKITEPLGVSLISVEEYLPAFIAGIEPGTIINSINGTRIDNTEQFLTYMQSTKKGDHMLFESKDQSYTVKAIEHPQEKPWGFIGVSVQNVRDVKPEYTKIKAPYYWLKGLFRWLFILNFLIGFINLLPVFITDGGRMLELALRNIFKDKGKAAKLYSLIATLFLLTIIISLVLNYGSKLFGL